MSTRQLCTFSLDGLLFGVEVASIREVLRHQDVTPVPLAPATVRGLINLRGRIVTAIEMRVRLGLTPRGTGERPMNIVVATATDGIVSLLVDDIGDVIEVDDSASERAPEAMSAVFREVVSGVFKLEGQLLLLLDVTKVPTSAPREK